MIDQIDEDDKTTSLFFFEEDEKPFCKIEHSEKGILFYQANTANDNRTSSILDSISQSGKDI